MSLLASIVTRWGQVSQLTTLVPVARIIIGEPTLGWPIPAIALTGYTRTKQTRVPTNRIDAVTLRTTIEAASANDVEAIADAIRNHLCPVTVDSRQLVAWFAYTFDLTRDPTSKNYIATATFDFYLW
jgi:hypothetical protein